MQYRIFSDDVLYINVLRIVVEYGSLRGVHLDIGCGLKQADDNIISRVNVDEAVGGIHKGAVVHGDPAAAGTVGIGTKRHGGTTGLVVDGTLRIKGYVVVSQQGHDTAAAGDGGVDVDVIGGIEEDRTAGTVDVLVHSDAAEGRDIDGVECVHTDH